jgi:nucleotide-binding universal stress UspA family protein
MTVIDPLRDSSLPQTYRTESGAQPVIDQHSARRLLKTRQMLEQTGACLLLNGFSASWEILEGSTVSSLVSATCPGDLIVMTNHGRGGNMIWPLGSTADAMCRRCPFPIVLVQSGGGPSGDEAMVSAMTAPPPTGGSAWKGTVATW